MMLPALPTEQWGIEFEYLVVDTHGVPLDFTNTNFTTFQQALADKPGCSDPLLAVGDLGIRQGYWYVEGDERFHPDGRFHTMAIKGVEIRTPPRPSIAEALCSLVDIEAALAACLDRQGWRLACAGFNPCTPRYAFDPPLNPWEAALRAAHPEYQGQQVSTLSYGPDINLSHRNWTAGKTLDVARKLNYYSPWLVPFSFSSPFHGGKAWTGWSKRTYERCVFRPAVKVYGPREMTVVSPLQYPARLETEVGRIEFKAFDAFLSQELLAACCHLLRGVCLATDLPGRSDQADPEMHRRAALEGFGSPLIRDGARQVLTAARRALGEGAEQDGTPLDLLEQLLETAQTPAHWLLAAWQAGHPPYRPGGLGSPLPPSLAALAGAGTGHPQGSGGAAPETLHQIKGSP